MRVLPVARNGLLSAGRACEAISWSDDGLPCLRRPSRLERNGRTANSRHRRSRRMEGERPGRRGRSTQLFFCGRNILLPDPGPLASEKGRWSRIGDEAGTPGTSLHFSQAFPCGVPAGPACFARPGLSVLAACRPTAPEENRRPFRVQAHLPHLGHALCKKCRLDITHVSPSRRT